MAISEETRHRLHLRLDDVLGPEEASTLMEHLPPVGWADVATKRDLDSAAAATKSNIDKLGAELRGEMAKLGGDLRAEFKGDLQALTVRLVMVMAAVMAALMAGLGVSIKLT